MCAYIKQSVRTLFCLVGMGSFYASSATLTVGAQTVQALVAQQLFNRNGRWYVLDEGPCYAYLESPQTHLENGRLYLKAHLSSRLGQQVGGNCLGVGLASNITLSARLRGQGNNIALEEIKVEQIEDDATGNAINVLNQLAPQALPKALDIDVAALVRSQNSLVAGKPVKLDKFKISSIDTQSNAIVASFDFSLVSP